MSPWHSPPLCGCFFIAESIRKYLPQVKIDAHTTILASTSRTTLTQTFTNPYSDKELSEIRYVFPLYDGVSVVAFTCTVDTRVIKGVVKEREKAKKEYKDATERGETAGLLEQSLEAADVFTTTIGNVPAGEIIKVDITYLGELKHDAEVDGVRFTIPTIIAPRYGDAESLPAGKTVLEDGGISITVDAEMPDGSAIKSLQSPSHPISVNIGTISTAATADPSLQRASATLSLASNTTLEKDFIIHVVATNLGNPAAILETHPTIPNQRALMATLVPKFNLTPDKPEIVFVCDRSGSMSNRIADLRAALQTFLKSLPVGVKFNICSFGSHHDFLWSKSKTYDQDSLDRAVKHVQGFTANYGGTEMYGPVEDTFKRRYEDMNLEVFLLTDGQIWDSERLFELINDKVTTSKGTVRVFTLGVGQGASTSLIEGAARAGKGFAQLVGDNEKMDKKVVRMLKGALSPHITDYSLEIKYNKAEADSDDDFELVEKVVDALKIGTTEEEGVKAEAPKKPISLFNPDLKDEDTPGLDASSIGKKYEHLPAIPAPRYLQTPFEIPPLFPFNRTSVYVLVSDNAPERTPKSVLLKGTSPRGPLELEIPITILGEKGTTIHQLAARKEVKELEEGRGWLAHAKDQDGKLLKTKHEGRFSDMVEREAVRLGVDYQVGGKWCSFVAIQDTKENTDEIGEFQILPAKDRVDPYGNQGGISRLTRQCALPAMAMKIPAPLTSMSSRSRTFGGDTRASDGGAPRYKTGGRSARGGFGRPAPAASSDESSGVDEGFGLFDAISSTPAPPPPPAPSASHVPGGGGFGSALFSTGASGGAALGGLPGAAPPQADMSKKKKKEGGFLASLTRSRASSRESSSPSPPAPALDASNPLEALVSLQTFSGSWGWSTELEAVLGITSEKAGELDLPGQPHGDVLATLCAVAFLKTRLAADKESWEMLVDKAETWLRDHHGEDVEELEKQVAVLF